MIRYIYFVRGTKTNLIKIGSAVNVHKRIRGLQNVSPDKLNLLGICAENSNRTEESMHARFHAERKHGEWFMPSARLLRYIKKQTVVPDERKQKQIPISAGSLNTPGSIGWLILGKRNQTGWTQADLADKSGVSRQFVCQVEKGHHRAELGMVLRLLSALNITLKI